MMDIEEAKKLAWPFVIETKPEDEDWELSGAVFAIIRSQEFWYAEVRRRQDTIYKLRAENRRLKKELRNKGT